MDPVHEDLLRKAVAAAKDADIEAAREFISEVLEEDEQNLSAWMLLARITNNVDEKRMALSTVLEMAPNNARARAMMDKLDAEAGGKSASKDIIPGVSRKQFQMMLFGGVGVVLVVVVLIVLLSGGSSDGNLTAEQLQIADSQTRAVALQTHEIQTATQLVILQAAQTQVAIETATAVWLAEITATPTTTPTPTTTSTRPTPLPPPPIQLPGTIFGWGKQDIVSNEDYPLAMFPLVESLGERVPVGDAEGRFVSVSPDGELVLYTEDSAADTSVKLVTRDGEELVSGIGLTTSGDISYTDTMMGRFSRDGTQYVFVGQAVDTGTTELYLMELPLDRAQLEPSGDISGFKFRRLTNDPNANFYFPSLSPNNTQVVAVREDVATDNPGRDLVLINLSIGTVQPLTRDRNALAEYHTDWSPNGQLITFSAVAEGQPEDNRDLYIISAAGGNPIRIVGDPSDDIYPVYSPDGSYLAFASNRAADYNIFVLDTASQQIFAQITDYDEPTFPGGWSNP